MTTKEAKVKQKNNGTITTKNFRGDSGHKTGLHASATLP